MTTVQQIYTIRSFRNSKDRDFAKALNIYAEDTHPQTKTDSREIADWLDSKFRREEGRFYICGMYIATDLIGYTEFIYLPKERLIHVDYFVIAASRRTAGAFYTFADQMRGFFSVEKLDWDFVTAEVAELDPIKGVSKCAQRLTRLFRQVGFSEISTPYEQPHLGIANKDTAIKARLLVMPRVPMQTISRDRYLELLSGIYRKHYGVWYSIYSDTFPTYNAHLEHLLREALERLRNHPHIALLGPEREFSESGQPAVPPIREAIFFFGKLLLSIIATAAVNFAVKHKTEMSFWGVAGITLSVFVLLITLISLTDKKRLESFKFIVSLAGKFFD